MTKESLEGSFHELPIETIRSLFKKLCEDPVKTLMELAPERKAFILTLKRKQCKEFSGEERKAAARILFSSLSTTDLGTASEKLFTNVVLMGEDNDYPIYRLVKNEVERRREEDLRKFERR